MNKGGFELNIMAKCIYVRIFGPIGSPWSEIRTNMNHLKTIALLGYIAHLGYINCIPFKNVERGMIVFIIVGAQSCWKSWRGPLEGEMKVVRGK